MSDQPSGFVNNSDLSQFFPPYEIASQSFQLTTGSTGFNLPVNLLRNKTGQSSYLVFSSINITSGDAGVLSENSMPVLIYGKEPSKFYYILKFKNYINYINFTINFLVIYVDSLTPQTHLVSSLKFNVGAGDTSGTSLVNNFPQYSWNTYPIDFSKDSQYESMYIDKKGYTGSPLNYKLLGGYEYISSDFDPNGAATAVNYLTAQILFLTTPSDYRNDSYYEYGFGNKEYSGTLKINVTSLSLFPNLSSTPWRTASDYVTNFYSNVAPSGSTRVDLASLFPRVQYYEYQSGDKNSSGTITGGFNYYSSQPLSAKIFAAYFYNTRDGSGGTYNVWNASIRTYQILITGQSTTGFTFSFSKETGDHWNGGVGFLVISP